MSESTSATSGPVSFIAGVPNLDEDDAIRSITDLRVGSHWRCRVVARASAAAGRQVSLAHSGAKLSCGEAVDLARVGRKLTPKSWPNGSRVAVCLSFDADTEAPLLRDGTTSPTALSASDFGAESGMPRILAMLDRHQIPATFFITAVDAMLHPDMIAAILKSGRHEIGVHGWIHEFTPRARRRRRRAAARSGDRVSDEGHRQAAGRLPCAVVGVQPGDARPDSEEGLSLRQQPAGARRAVRDRVARQAHRDRRAADRLDADRDAVSSARTAGCRRPTLLYQLYKDEFDGAYEERTMFVLTLHPYLSGHRAPMQHLEEFVTYMKSKPGVWFATAADIARHVKVSNP